MDHPAKCRLCSVPSPEQRTSITDSAVRAKLDVVFKFELPVDDLLPTSVCSECSTKVDEFYSFHEAVRSHQVQLKTESSAIDATALLMVEVKGEPADDAGTDTSAAAAVAAPDDDEDDDDGGGDYDNSDSDDDYVPPTNEKKRRYSTRDARNHQKKSTAQAVESVQDEDVEGKKNNHLPDEDVKDKKSNRLSNEGVKGKRAKRLPDKDDEDKQTKRLPSEDVKEKKRKFPEDSWKIEQFFNGITCSICLEKMETFGKLRTHCKRIHGQKASITCCNRKYFKKCHLIEHIDSHQDSKRFFCDVCKKNYGSKEYLRLHKLQFHSGVLPYQCTECGKKFSKESMLTAHLKQHIHVQCSVCDRRMANIHSLKIHMLKIHSEQPREAPETHICDFCGQVYRLKQSLEKHINLQHLGAKDTDRIQCPVCSKWVNNKQYLKVHMRNAHSGADLRVTCDLCLRTCANKRSLSTHKNKVHAERKLECEVCGKMFKLPKHLKEHRAAHMGQQLYTCSLCGYGSNYNGNLYTHMKNKHPDEYAEARAKGGTLLITQEDPSQAM